MVAMKHFFLFLVILVGSHKYGTVTAYDFLLQEMIRPFMTCADEHSIPRDKSTVPSLNNDITTLRIGYDIIMTCIQSKLPTLQKSTNVMEWYIGHKFSIVVAASLKTRFSNSKAYDFSCLQTDSQMNNRTTCFNTTYVKMTSLYHTAQQYGYTFQQTLDIISQGMSDFQPEGCFGDSCSSGIKEFLTDVLLQALAGRACTTPTPSSPIPTMITHEIVTSGSNMGNSAIFACGDQVFNDSLDHLFPPSETTVTRVTNTTADVVVLQMRKSMEIFCAKRNPYAACVVRRIDSDRSTLLDTFTNYILSAHTLEDAFNIFCDNQDLILSQYNCTFNAVSGGLCHGGVEDLLKTAAKKLGKIRTYHLCKELKSAVSCRLRTQLSQCSAEYATVMERFYDNIFGPKCYPEGFRPSPSSDIMPCFADYYESMAERFAATGRKEPDIPQLVGTEIDYICKNEVESMGDCMIGVYSYPKKPVDKLIAKIFAPKNIKPLAKRLCALKQEFKSHLPCIINGFKTLASQSRSCWTDFAEKASKIIPSVTAVQDVDKIAEDMCSLLPTVGPCVTTVFSTCDSSLGNDIKTIIGEVKAACNNPNYQIKDGTSSASCYSISSIIFPVILLSFLVL